MAAMTHIDHNNHLGAVNNPHGAVAVMTHIDDNNRHKCLGMEKYRGMNRPR